MMSGSSKWKDGWKRPRRASSKEGETLWAYILRLFDEGKLIYDNGDLYVNYDFSRKDGKRDSPKKVTKLDHKGYYRHHLTVNGKGSPVLVHRMIYAYHHRLTEFPSGLIINHKNGVKTDNRIENLEIVTHKENIRHAIQMGLRDPQKTYQTKLDWEKVAEIRSLINDSDKTHKQISEIYGLSKSTVDRIAQNRAWRDESWQKTRGQIRR